MNPETPSQSLNPGARPYHRSVRNVIIHKEMQREFTFMMVVLLMVSMLAIGFAIHDTIHQAAQGEGLQFGKINPFEILSEVRYQLILKVSCILFTTLVIIGIFGVLFLHRVAGPVYHFRQVFQKMRQGQIPNPIRLRGNDFFMETAEEINQMLDVLKARQENQQKIRQKIDQILSQSSGTSLQKPLQELKGLLGT